MRIIDDQGFKPLKPKLQIAKKSNDNPNSKVYRPHIPNLKIMRNITPFLNKIVSEVTLSDETCVCTMNI